MDFLAEENVAGQTLLRLVSRGNAIIAELLRLSDHIPQAYRLDNKDPAWKKYTEIIFDFTYLKQGEYHENKIENNSYLQDLDEEFKDSHIELLKRFYLLFESIYKYVSDLKKFLEDLESGVFIQLTLEIVLMNVDGKQLLCEAAYLYGVMLILLDERIEGPVRERLLISYLRYKGQSELQYIDEVCKLCQNTGYTPSPALGAPPARRPAGYPENYFARHPLPPYFVEMTIGRLRSDDVYNQILAYPLPEHRSTALATQACMLYVVLYFAPQILHEQQAVMREIVDKHFSDNWVLSYYLGFTVDISIMWAPYKAASLALANTLELRLIQQLTVKFVGKMDKLLADNNHYLQEGVLLKDFILDNAHKLMSHVRECNVVIRWLMLHTNSVNKKLREIVTTNFDYQKLLNLLLKSAQFEFVLKNQFQALIDTKLDQWDECKKQSSERVKELGEYYSGEKVLTRVTKNENLQKWFFDIAEKINSLDYNDSTLAGRKIQQLIQALAEVEQYHEIETNLQVKQFLIDTRQYLNQMIRVVNVKEDYMVTIATVGDISYVWQIINNFTNSMQEMIRKDPASVLMLRSTFFKLASILDLPLVRINQAQSPDLFSVSEYYSTELVAYVRKVLEVIPQSMFIILREIIDLQTNKLSELPTKVEKDRLKEFAQPEDRYRLARATHAVSVFTEGILAMETTLVGIIEVDPKKLLEDGIRKELVNHIATALDQTLSFKTAKIIDFESKLNHLAAILDGYRRSFEYIQDYVNIYGLKIWQEEFSRIINFNVEQECNSFLKKKVLDWQSVYQSKSIPIPVFPPSDAGSVNFIGRLAKELLLQTDPQRTVYLDQMSGWFEYGGRELVGIRTFSLLLKSVGVFGVRGLDKLICFMIVKELQQFIEKIRVELKQQNLISFWKNMEEFLSPPSTIPQNTPKIYQEGLYKGSKLWPYFMQIIMKIGQMQLVRKQIAQLLNFQCKLESNNLYGALDVINRSLLTDIRAHYASPDTKPYPDDDNPLLTELTKYLETSGISDPFMKIYVTSPPIEHYGVLMFFFVISQMSKFVFNPTLGILGSANKKGGVDGTVFLVGVLTFLKQFHSVYTQQLLAYIGQYIRATIVGTSRDGGKPQDLPVEISNILVFLEQFCKFTDISRKSVESYVPAYIFDTFKRA